MQLVRPIRYDGKQSLLGSFETLEIHAIKSSWWIWIYSRKEFKVVASLAPVTESVVLDPFGFETFSLTDHSLYVCSLVLKYDEYVFKPVTNSIDRFEMEFYCVPKKLRDTVSYSLPLASLFTKIWFQIIKSCWSYVMSYNFAFDMDWILLLQSTYSRS